jgi:quinol-cytochrome oxidoreductase complex cytochrome b subunit
MFPWVLVIAFTGTILVAVYWAGVGRPLIGDLAKLALAGGSWSASPTVTRFPACWSASARRC